MILLVACGQGVDESPAASSTAAVSTQLEALSAPMILSPVFNEQVLGPEVLFRGTSKPGSLVLVAAVNGGLVCQSSTNTEGEWECVASLRVGPHEVVATASLGVQQSAASNVVPFEVLADEMQAGGGCSVSAGGSSVLLALALVALRRGRR